MSDWHTLYGIFPSVVVTRKRLYRHLWDDEGTVALVNSGAKNSDQNTNANDKFSIRPGYLRFCRILLLLDVVGLVYPYNLFMLLGASDLASLLTLVAMGILLPFSFYIYFLEKKWDR